MQTFLIWGAHSEASFEVARALAAQGHRLLLIGDPHADLQVLDASLAQSELHRYRHLSCPETLADWVAEQELGLDGVVLFPPPPDPDVPLVAPVATTLRLLEATVFEPVEVIRQLAPKGQSGVPKCALVVLEWLAPLQTSERGVWPAQVWSALLPSLSAELRRQQVHVNLVELGVVIDQATRQVIADEAPDPAAATAHLQELAQCAPGKVLLDAVDVARMVCPWVTAPLAALSGQRIVYPER